ncbi:MAG: hypothetical protein LJE84_03985 [Gammaproteobacteria bacterium]|nr:hypothetical protein [Gammaproteobacteria bacterium]
MNRKKKTVFGRLPKILVATSALLVLFQAPAWASGTASLEQRLKALEREVQELRALLKQEKEAAATKEDVQAAKEEVAKVVHEHSEWKNAKSVVHLAGYGDATFVAPKGEDSHFEATFNPIFHFQFGDKLMMESEIEMELNEDGDADVVLEYAALDYFLNDNATIVAGRFLSPIGQFRQNGHPTWINKLPAHPIGFGDGGAALLNDIGVEVRGGFSTGDSSSMNYAAFLANGPELRFEEGDDGLEPEMASEGYPQDPGNNKIVGGRIGVRPVPHFEVGVSGGVGQVPVSEGGELVEGEPQRDWHVVGADASYQSGQNIDLRTEWIRQEVDADASSAMFPDKLTWEAWYAQAAYKALPSNFEGVVRYGRLDTPSFSEKQWTFGINYLFASNIISKFAYEMNDESPDRWLAQLSYGY